MVDPWRRFRGAVGPILAALTAGCAMVPRSQLEDCHKRSQALHAETAQLKDTAARLRDQNRDYAQRTVDDARRLRALEEVNARLERSVAAYQEDVDRLEAAWEQVRRQVEAVATSPREDERQR